MTSEHTPPQTECACYFRPFIWPLERIAITLALNGLLRAAPPATMSSDLMESDSSLPAAPSWPRRLGEVLLILLVFFTLAGEVPPHNNEAHYLARLKHFWDPGWCQGDLFLESADTQIALIWTFGWVTRWLSLPATAWLGRLIVWTLLAFAWQRLSWRLVPRPLASMLSAALFVTCLDLSHLAGEWVVGGVEGKAFAYGFVLLGLRELIDRRWNRLGLLLGAACAFHPLVGGWSAVICGGIWLIMDRRHVALTSMLPGLAGGGLLALVGVVPALTLTWNEPSEVVAEANRIYVFERLPHHLALLRLPPGETRERLVRHATLLVVLFALTGMARGATSPAIDFGGLRRMALFACGAALLALMGLMIELAFWNHPLLAARVQKYYWYRLTDVAAPLAVAFYAVGLIAAGMDRRRPWAVVALMTAVALAGWHLMSLSLARYSNPMPPADSRMRDYEAWVDVCEWVAENTPPDALFLTPRMAHSFKWRTGRPEVVTRKDIPQDARSIVEWHRRLRTIHYRLADGEMALVRSLGHLGAERIQQLADEFGFDYLITDRRRPLALPVVYRNEEYVVHRVAN